MPAILFVCTANQFRSPIAAACLQKVVRREDAGGEWTIESAGTWTREGLPAPEFTLQAAQRLGLTGLEQHATRQVSQALLERFDLVVVMESGQREALRIEFPPAAKRVFLLSEIVNGIDYDIPDPSNPAVNAEQVGRKLFRLVIRGSSKILALAKTLHGEG